MRIVNPFSFIVLSCVVVLSVGCVTEPRNKAAVGASAFTISGYVPATNQPIRARVWNYGTQQWLDWGGSTQSSTSGTADCAGTTWASFSHVMLVPRAANLFGPSAQNWRNEMRVQTTVGPDRIPLATFEADTGTCGQQLCAGMDIINQCKSPESPVLTLQVPCGQKGEACCHSKGPTGCGENIFPFVLCDGSFTCSEPDWLTYDQYQSRNDSPTNIQRNWTKEAQGLATDGSSWFITQAADLNRMWKVPFNTSWGDFSTSSRTTNSLGCDHWGDPDVYGGVVYVPLENCGASGHMIAAFRASDLSLIGTQSTGTPHLAWVAVNPADGRLYIAPGYDIVSTLRSYKLEVNASAGTFVLSDPKTLNIYKREPIDGWVSYTLGGVQGGAFSNAGKLYLSQNLEGDAFGGQVAGLQVSAKGAFLMVAFSMPINHNLGIAEEAEGIEIFPTTTGDIHVLVLDNDWPDDDNAFIKHYKITDGTRL